MPSHIIVQTALETTSLKPEDYMVNTWYFELTATPPDAASEDLVKAALQNVYSSIGASFSSQVMTGKVTTKMYNAADSKPRKPIRTFSAETWFSGANTTPMPQEVAIVGSYKGVSVSGVPDASRRGRVYFSGWQSASSGTVVPSGVVTVVKNAMNGLLTASDGSAAWSWVGYSRKRDEFWAVTSGWVDNAWDTQRRRGIKATTRTTWP